MTSRGPLTLAALASAAVPGLDPDTVEGVVPSGPADTLEVAFIQDREHRRWVIRCPRTPAASAQLQRSAALLHVLARRLTMPVPAVRGWAALPEGGRAAVHSYLTGRIVDLEGIEAGTALARGLGRALAHLHNLDPRTYEEAGVPVYDAAGYRTRRLAELDRAAATGRVPTGLLNRWERVLDDESKWGFTATPTHGDLGSRTILATPDDGSDPDVKAFLGWESAQVADPADDIAPLLSAMDAEAFDTVIESYAHARVERPDRHLHARAQVIGEMQLVRTMMVLVAAGDEAGAEDCAAQLRRLDDRLAREEEDAARTHGTSQDTQPVTVRPRTGQAAPAAAAEATDEAVQVEHPAKVTPVAASEEADGETDEAGDETPADAAAEPKQPAAPEESTQPRAAEGADESSEPSQADDTEEPETNPVSVPTIREAPAAPTSTDQETAEIVPLSVDDEDDVQPPH